MLADPAGETLRYRGVWSLEGICCGRDRLAPILRRGFRRTSSRFGIYLTGRRAAAGDRGSSASDRFRVESRGAIAVPQTAGTGTGQPPGLQSGRCRLSTHNGRRDPASGGDDRLHQRIPPDGANRRGRDAAGVADARHASPAVNERRGVGIGPPGCLTSAPTTTNPGWTGAIFGLRLAEAFPSPSRA